MTRWIRAIAASILLLTRRSPSRRGQAMVEMALVCPVLALLLMGTLDEARFIGTQMTVMHAAETGVLVAQNTQDANGTPINVATVVAAVQTAYPPATVTVVPTVITGTTNIAPDSQVTVHVSVPFHPLFHVIGPLFGTREAQSTASGSTLP